MGLFSFLNKNKQAAPVQDSGFYSADDAARNKRASHAGASAQRGAGRGRDAADPVLPEKKRARRRLVGAVALALGVAIGLPMLLDSEPKPLANDIAIQIPSKDKPGAPEAGGASSQVAAGATLDQSEEIVTLPVKSGSKASAEPLTSESPAAPAPTRAVPTPAASKAESRLLAESTSTAPTPAAPTPAAPTPAAPTPAAPTPAAPKHESRLSESKPAETKHEVKPAEPTPPAPAPTPAAPTPAAPTPAALKREAKVLEPKPSEFKHEAAKAPEVRPVEAKHDVKTVETRPAESRAPDAVRALSILEGKPAAPDAPATKYVIQVAALASQEKIDELQAKLRDAGIKYFTQKVPTAAGERTRVRVGPFPNKDEAEKMRARLIKSGLGGTLVPA